MSNKDIKLNDNGTDTSNYIRIALPEEDLIDEFLFSIIRGDAIFMTQPDSTGYRKTAISVEDILKAYKEFQKKWKQKDA